MKKYSILFMLVFSIALCSMFSACGDNSAQISSVSVVESKISETAKPTMTPKPSPSATPAETPVEIVKEEVASGDYNENEEIYDNTDVVSDKPTPVDEARALYVTDDDTWIECENGDIYSYAAGDFDCILDYGGGYYILCKNLSTFEEQYYESGILRANGTWVYEYGEKDWTQYSFDYQDAERNPGVSDFDVTVNNDDDHILSRAYSGYCGADVFLFKELEATNFWLTSMENGTILEGDDGLLLLRSFGENDYALVGRAKEVKIFLAECQYDIYIITSNEVIGELDLDYEDKYYTYADGGFVFYQDGTLKFFDCAARTTTDICPDPDKLILEDSYEFADGQLALKLEGADGQTYAATVDKQGNYIEEPHVEQNE